MWWWQTDIFSQAVSGISFIFFLGLGTFFCFLYSFLFGAFNPVSVIAGSIFLSFLSSAAEAIHLSNSTLPVIFIVKLVLPGLLVSLVVSVSYFLTTDSTQTFPVCYLESQVHAGPHPAELLSTCPILLKLVGPPCVLILDTCSHFREREQSPHLARVRFRDPVDLFLTNLIFTCPSLAPASFLPCAISFPINHLYNFPPHLFPLHLCIPH